MILQALVSYYDRQARKGVIPRLGWGTVRVQYALEIDDGGRLLAIQPLESIGEKGKPIPRYMTLPAAVKRSVNVAPNFLWDNAAYLLGADAKGNPERTLRCFASARELHLQLLDGLDDPYAKALCAFFRTWTPEAGAQQGVLSAHGEELSGGANCTFMYKGRLPYQIPALGDAWQRHYGGGEQDAQGGQMRCLVTGERSVPEPVHPAIKNVRGAQSSGAALVSFNAPAFCSYDREQNLNAPVGKYAAFAYTTALNTLLSDKDHVKQLGDTTVVYWAEDAQGQYQDAFGCFLSGDTVTDGDLRQMMGDLARGQVVHFENLPLVPENKFYVLGISPNAARLSVRFFLQSTFGEIAQHLMAHYDRLEIVRPDFDGDALLPLWKLLRETVNPNARDKAASPQLAGDTLRAILSGGRYPATLYQQTMLRIRAEHTVSRGKAAIIKAYLMRNSNDTLNKEALTVELNEKTDYLPYVLGRLFSVLEAIQQKANPGINTTIRDKYFTSACATPAVVLPRLLDLAGKHLRKMDEGSRIWYAKQLQSLLAMVHESYPVHMTLADQGIFQLGYYHQTQKRYEKKNTEAVEEEKEYV